MTLESLEAQAAALSVPTVFDEQSGREVLAALTNGSPLFAGEVTHDPIRSLRLAGLLREWNGVMRIADPMRENLRRRLATEAPTEFRRAASQFASHTANGLGERLASALGPQPAAVAGSLLRLLGASPDSERDAVNELVAVVTGPASRGRRIDGLAAARQLQVLPERSPQLNRTLHFLLGLDAWRREDRRSATERFARVVAQPGGDRAEAISRHLIGVAMGAEGDFQAALSNLSSAVLLLRSQGDDRGLAQTLTSLGRVLRAAAAQAPPHLGAISEEFGSASSEQLLAATAALEEAANLGQTLGEALLEGSALLELARVERDQGSVDSALDLAEQASELLRNSDEDLLIAFTFMGGLYRDVGLDRAASEILGEAARLAERSGKADLGLARVLNVQASADRRAGRTSEAIKRARESVELGERLEDPRHTAHALHTLAAALLDLGTVSAVKEADLRLATSAQLLRLLQDRRGLRMVEQTRTRIPGQAAATPDSEGGA